MLEYLQKQLFIGVFQSRCSKKFHNIHRKTPVLKSLFDKVAGLTAHNFNKKRLLHRCFPVNIAKFLRTGLFIEHFWWLLLYLFNKVAGLKISNVIKKRPQHRCFPVKFAKVLRTPFFNKPPFVAASEQIWEISVVHCVAKGCSGHLAQVYLIYPISC